MPHYKGVSHYSDNKILRALLENQRLSSSEIQKITGLNKTTIPKRLEILEKKGMIIREVLKKRGHHIENYIPWFKRDQIYHKIYGKFPPWVGRLKNQITKSFSEYGIEEITIAPDMIMKIRLKKFEKNIESLLSDIAETFGNQHLWVKDLPYDKGDNHFDLWCKGLLCPDCLKSGPVEPLNYDKETNEYICPNCGTVYNSLQIPPIIIEKIIGVSDNSSEN